VYIVCTCIETVATAAVKDHRARVVKAKKLDAIPLEMLLSRSTAGAQDAGVGASRTPVKLPPIYLHIDDVGKITRRKVPFVRPHVWDTWDQNAPAHGYESLSNITRNSIFPGEHILTQIYTHRQTHEEHTTFEVHSHLAEIMNHRPTWHQSAQLCSLCVFPGHRLSK